MDVFVASLAYSGADPNQDKFAVHTIILGPSEILGISSSSSLSFLSSARARESRDISTDL